MKKIFFILTIFFCVRNSFGQCWIEASAGFLHSIAIKSDGTLWTWGNNQHGELGDNSNIAFRTFPQQVGTANNWQIVKAGFRTSYALKNDNTLWGWGANIYGQLGIGNLVTSNVPVQIGTASDWLDIAVGEQFCVAIKVNGTLWAWGRNDEGQLGDGTNMQKLTPTQIGTETNWNKVATTGKSTVAIKANGTIWRWGLIPNYGVGGTTFGSINSPVQFGTDADWYNVAGGAIHVLAIKQNGTLWGWGNNQSFQLGYVSTVNTAGSNLPIQIGTSTNWIELEGGGSTSFAIQFDGNFQNSLWGCGHNSYGSIGIGGNPPPAGVSPISITSMPTNVPTYKVSAYQWHTLAINFLGELYATGWNNSGQLGDGSQVDKPLFTKISCNPILPIELLSFYATKNQNGNQLNWQTASETNNKGFEIQSSSDGINFTKIGFMVGKGNSSQIVNYNFTDNSNCTDKIFYRLKQIDDNGNFTFSNIVRLNCNTQTGITIYPNPAKDFITIASNKKFTQLILVNATGQTIKKWQPVLNNKYSLKGVNPGVYFLNMQTASGILVEKVFVQ